MTSGGGGAAACSALPLQPAISAAAVAGANATAQMPSRCLMNDMMVTPIPVLSSVTQRSNSYVERRGGANRLVRDSAANARLAGVQKGATFDPAALARMLAALGRSVICRGTCVVRG